MNTETPDDDLPVPLEQVDPAVAALLADRSLWDVPSDDLGDRVVRAIESETEPSPLGAVPQRRRSWRSAVLGAAAAILLIFVGLVAFSALDSSSVGEVLAVDLVPTGLIDDVEGSIEMTEFPSGLRIDFEAVGLPRRDGGNYYEGWVRTSDDRLVSVGSFHSGAEVVLWAGVDLDQVVVFTVTMEQMVEPTSPEQATSGQIVLKADLPSP
jgi:hypothetical protein